MITVSTRLDEKVLKEIEEIARELNLERGVLIRKFILDGYLQKVIEKNIILIEKGEISIGQAANNAGVSIYKILDEAHRLKIAIGADESTVTYELEGIKKRFEEN